MTGHIKIYKPSDLKLFDVSSMYLTDYRLTAASHLLRRTQEPVTTIAASCGFESLSYFIRKFKARYGTSPGSYRKQRSDDHNLAKSGGKNDQAALA